VLVTVPVVSLADRRSNSGAYENVGITRTERHIISGTLVVSIPSETK